MPGESNTDGVVYVGLAQNFTLGHNCHIRQFCKVSIELPYMTVLWTHFCVDRTAIYVSFMDTFFSPTKLPHMAVLWTLFGCLSPKPTKLRTSVVLWTQNLRPTKLPYMAVLWTLFGCLSQNPYKTADLRGAVKKKKQYICGHYPN